MVVFERQESLWVGLFQDLFPFISFWVGESYRWCHRYGFCRVDGAGNLTWCYGVGVKSNTDKLLPI